MTFFNIFISNKTMSGRLYLFLLGLLLSISSNAQLQFVHYTTENGLPNNSSEAILRDSYGFLWVGTYNGLSKYDGTKFQNYPVCDSSNGIKGSTVFKLFEDSKTQLWIGTNNALIFYDRKHDSFSKKIDNVCISNIIELSNGRLLITSLSGLIEFDTHTNAVVRKIDMSKGLPSNTLTQSVIDSKGTVWVGTQSDGLFSFNLRSGKIVRFKRTKNESNTLLSNRIKSLVFDSNGKLWIGTCDAGICVLDTLSKHFSYYTNSETLNGNAGSNLVLYLFLDSKKDLWVCQNGYLLRFNKKTNTFSSFKAERFNDRFIQSNSLCFISEDKDGNYWFGSYGSGIYCLNKQQNSFRVFSSIPEKENCLKSNTINSFAEYGDAIIVGLDNAGLQYFYPKTYTFKNFESSTLNSTHILDLKKDNDELWCSTWGEGVYNIQLKTKSITHYIHNEDNVQSLSTNNIRTSSVIDGSLWIGTWGDGLNKLDANRKTIYLHDQIVKGITIFNKPSWISRIIKDSKNRIWITTLYGVYVSDKGVYSVYHNDSQNSNSLHDDNVYSVYEDSNHQIWLATNRGLDKFIEKTKSFEHFGKEKNLPSNPMAMLEDGNHTLWISSSDGLYSFNEKTNIVRKYDYRNGIIKGEFSANAALKAFDGTLYFGGKNGFIMFKPESFKPSFITPNIVLRKYYIDNVMKQTLENSDSLVLAYSISIVTIDVVDLKDIVSNLASFSYMFENRNKSWKSIDDTKKIVFSNNQPGTYILHIRATYDNKKYSEKVLFIVVIPPWWMTTWFKLLCVAIILFLFYSFYKIRLQVIQNKNEQLSKLVDEKTASLVEANKILRLQNTDIAEKELLLQIRNDELQKTNTTKDKLFSIISHDLKTHFTGIMDNSHNLNKSRLLKNENERLTFINSIYSSSKKIQSLIDLFLQWSRSQTKTISFKSEDIDVETIIRENISLSYGAASTKQIDIQFNFEHQYNAFVDSEMFTIVLRNLIGNAIKYTPKKGNILIQTSNTADFTVIQVKDDGVGMSQEQITNVYTKSVLDSTPGTDNELGTGLGLIICRDFLNSNKAKIEISSQIGEGCSVTIFLPKGNAIRTMNDAIPEENTLDESSLFEDNENELESKLQLLIVEDNLEILQYIVDIFEPYYVIVTANNGEDGFIKALELIPDLIITDINMPVKNGIEMCLDIQSEAILCHIPVIILSALDNFETQAKGLKAGAFDFVVKPFDRSLLFLKVQSILESRNKYKEYLKKQFIQNPSTAFRLTPDDSFLMTMHSILEKNYAKADFSVEKFSTEMRYSRSQFYRKLNAIIGTNPLEYLKVFRLNKAKEMLETGKWTVSNVAYDVGFNDPHYFSICFKAQFGNPPNHFVKQKQ
jgi:ligand-binding sensor domain-containing protein/signal transduction histidine kinase/AraC-like DNA-binding protein